jgi:pimeloyl-ACP methyl ester carboxylesterase
MAGGRNEETMKNFGLNRKARRVIFALCSFHLIIVVAGAWAIAFPNVLRVFRNYGTPSEYNLVAEDVTLPSGEHAWWFARPGAKRTVLVCHGRSRNKAYMLPLIAFFAKENQVLAIDFDSHGENPFGTTSIGLRESQSVGAALDFLEKNRSGDVVVFGVSMGAAASLIWLSENPSPNVIGVISDGSFARLHPYLMAKSRALWMPPYLGRSAIALAGWVAGYDPHEVNPVNGLSRIQAPMLILHAASDRMTPVNNRELLMIDALPGTKTAVYPGGHDEPGNDAMQADIMNFMRSLAPGGRGRDRL